MKIETSYEETPMTLIFPSDRPTLADPEQYRLNRDAEEGWNTGQQLFWEYPNLNASCLFRFSEHMAMSYGWRFGSLHCGYPAGGCHDVSASETLIHHGNDTILRRPDISGQPRAWIYRVHFIHSSKPMEAVFGRILTL